MSMSSRAYPLTVLVVDDSPDCAESLAELLRFHGHAVRVALDGDAAIRDVVANPPDVVFLDILMPPGPDGCEVARRVRMHCASRGKQPLLIAVTGCGTNADQVRSAGAGFDLHLVKPVDPTAIVAMVERFRRLLAPSSPAAEPAHDSGPPPGAAGHSPFTPDAVPADSR